MHDDDSPKIADQPGDCRQLYQHTVSVINYDQAEPSVVGSGVFTVVDKSHFVVTAAHVFEPGFEKVGFGHLGKDGFEIFGSTNMNILTAKDQNGTGDARRAVYKDGLDLAVIEPNA